MSLHSQKTDRPDDLPKVKLSREEMATLEIGHTEMTPSVKWLLIVVFFTSILGVPLGQLAIEWLEARGEVNASSPFRVAAIARVLPEARSTWIDSEGSDWKRLTRTNAAVLHSLTSYENDLERGSFLRDSLLSPIQYMLVRQGAGNEKAYPGRDGWLFYRPTIDLLTGPGFLESTVLKSRSQGGSEWQAAPHPDPRPAIIGFHQALEARGIQLVIIPTPVKAMIHPEKFAARLEACDEPLLNSSHEAFVREMEDAGVLVFDPATLLFEAKQATGGSNPTFLATDTHWRPEAMDLVAKELAAFLRIETDLPTAARSYQRQNEEISGMGDIAAMLQLPADQDLYLPEPVTIQQVRDPDGKLWESAKEGELLLLGDSFSNIYSLEGMNWGKCAGFAEQLSYCLGLPLDSILRNDSGAFATRQMLAAELARGRDRLKGKRVVVWQFAARELAVGDWKPIALPDSPAPVPEPPTQESDGEGWTATISGVVAQASATTEERVPYKDHIRSLLLKDITVTDGALSEPDAVIFVQDMRENELTPEARLRAGDKVSLRLRPWDDVSSTLDRVNRSEFDDLELMMAIPWWGEVVR